MTIDVRFLDESIDKCAQAERESCRAAENPSGSPPGGGQCCSRHCPSSAVPDPAYPDGRRVSLAEHALQKTCTRNLPYPAPRCGAYSIKCRVCGFVGVVTVAGRPDDPRVVTIPCKAN